MTMYDHPNLAWQQERSGSWGNLQIAHVEIELPASATALDIWRLMRLRPGMRIHAVQMTLSTATSTDIDADIGYATAAEAKAFGALADGATNALQNAALALKKRQYFMSATQLDPVAGSRYVDSRDETNHKPLDIDEDSYLVLAFSEESVDITAAAELQFHILFEYIGK